MPWFRLSSAVLGWRVLLSAPLICTEVQGPKPFWPEGWTWAPIPSHITAADLYLVYQHWRWKCVYTRTPVLAKKAHLMRRIRIMVSKRTYCFYSSKKKKRKQHLQPVWTELGPTYHIQHQCTVLSLPKTPDLGPCMKTNQVLLCITEIIDYVNFIDI